MLKWKCQLSQQAHSVAVAGQQQLAQLQRVEACLLEGLHQCLLLGEEGGELHSLVASGEGREAEVTAPQGIADGDRCVRVSHLCHAGYRGRMVQSCPSLP